MFDQATLAELLDQYAQDFTAEHWASEGYKWQTVQQFQENWDIEAEDFSEMLNRALSATSNLLQSGNFYMRSMILEMARREPDKVRHMFAGLFDETLDVFDRIATFKAEANEILERHWRTEDSSHQDERAISAYLGLRYPDRYGFYKYREIKNLAETLGWEPTIKQGRYKENLQISNQIYDAVSAALKQHPRLRSILEGFLDDTCYPDANCYVFAQDFVFYLNQKNKATNVQTSPSQSTAPTTANDAEPASSSATLPAPASTMLEPANYFWMNCNPKIWSLQSMPVGAQESYTLYNENGNKRKIFTNFEAVQPGDLVIGYESTPAKKIVALLRMVKASDGQRIIFEKVEGLAMPIPLADIKEYMVEHHVEGAPIMQGSLFKLTKEQYDYLLDVIREANPTPASSESLPAYTRADFLSEVFMPEGDYDRLARRLKRQKNLILQGAPGVGKTFAARRLAFSLMGVKDEGRVQFVQFHQNYSYEDFVMGYKPGGEDRFELKEGIFYRFCRRAANQPDLDFYFIIDEINRAPLSKVFGELLSAIEADYRGTPVTLQYSGLPFDVPQNVHIIGMMNTADRSLAIIDYALRRRFGFHAMHPGFDNAQFQAHIQTLNPAPAVAQVLAQVRALNEAISQDATLGPGFQIGHSYFCAGRNITTLDQEALSDIVEFDLIPLLEEYWFDEPDSVSTWAQRLRDAASK